MTAVGYGGYSVSRASLEALRACDVFISAIGYEMRSTYVARSLIPYVNRVVGLSFASHAVLSYQKNVDWATGASLDVYDLDTRAFRHWFSDLEVRLAGARTVGLDVSSLNRDRIGIAIAALLRWVRSGDGRSLSLSYAPAQYKESAIQDSDPYRSIGSAELLAGFEGDYADSSLPLTAVMGLGYEPARAIGSVELLEATFVTTFLPTGVDSRYDRDVLHANGALMRQAARVVTLTYDVMAPWDLYAELLKILRGTELSGRAVVVPFGPKIFCAVACLAVAALPEQPAVWRVSAGGEEPVFDSLPAGPICVVSVQTNDH